MYRSNKKELLNNLALDATINLILSNKDQDLIFDEVIDDILAVSSFRYSIPRQPLPKSCEWLHNILPDLSDRRFKQFLRVKREDFGRILYYIENNPVFNNKGRIKQIPVEKQLGITLYKFGCHGSGSSIHKVGAVFGVGDGGTIMITIKRVIKALLDTEEQWISWPDADERRRIDINMQDKLPHCMGYLDGSLIILHEAPIDDPESYFTRKQNYAIQLQAVCDMDRRIRNLYVGFPGSAHDARVFNNSNLGRNTNAYLSEDQWLAADSAYGLSHQIITPFRKNSTHGTIAQRKAFNKYFSKYRVSIECCFGILKEIFMSLKGLRIRVTRKSGHKLACEWITACCILYNMILESLEDYDTTGLIYDEVEAEVLLPDVQRVNNGERKRQEIFALIIEKLDI